MFKRFFSLLMVFVVVFVNANFYKAFASEDVSIDNPASSDAECIVVTDEESADKIIANAIDMAEDDETDSAKTSSKADALDDKTDITMVSKSVNHEASLDSDLSISNASTDASSNASSDSLNPNEGFTTKSQTSKIYLTAHGKSKVVVKWKAVKGANKYRIYRKVAGGSFKLLKVKAKKKYVDKTVKYGKTYTYKIVPIRKTLKASANASTDAANLADTDVIYADNETASQTTIAGEEIDNSASSDAYSSVSSDASSNASADTDKYNIIVGKAKKIKFINNQIVATDHQKYTYSELQSDISLLKKNYHGLVSSEIFGKTEDNRNMYDVIIGNKDAKKCLMVVATLHAREYMTSMVTMSQIEYYLQNYYGKLDGKSVETTLNKVCIHFVPMANPDGVCICQSGFDSIRNATLRANLKKMYGSASQWKSNARGVDLNRNYPYCFKVRGIRGQEGYSGPSAASESETKALVSLIKELKKSDRLKGAVNYHTMGSIIFGDIKASAAAYSYTKKMYDVAKKTTGYASSFSVGYTSTGYGNLREYYMYSNKIPSITIEVGWLTNPVPISQFSSIWSRNKLLVIREARIFQ
ncbi:MAG: hypothetical protein K5656_04700 [Lachnospiraceae bacterium]|nr:hypothetical protein [Lachnospiraceae bacterium]